MAQVSIRLTEGQHTDLLDVVRNSGLPNALNGMLERAVKNGDGTRTLRLDSAVAKMIATSLTPTASTRVALNALDLAFYDAGGPDTGAADRSLIARAHERGAETAEHSNRPEQKAA